jgi:similar to spore coat protein
MSFLNIFQGNSNNKLAEKDIAMDMIKDSKFSIATLAAAATEAVNPQLRDMLRKQLDKAVAEHFELSDILINKGWYQANDEPMQQIKNEYDQLQNQNEQSQKQDDGSQNEK